MLYLTENEFKALTGPIPSEITSGSGGHIDDHVSIAAKLNLVPYDVMNFRKKDGAWELQLPDESWSALDNDTVQYYITTGTPTTYVVTDLPYSGGPIADSSITRFSYRVSKSVQSFVSSISVLARDVQVVNDGTVAVLEGAAADLTKTTYTRTRSSGTPWGGWSPSLTLPVECRFATISTPGGSEIKKIFSGVVTEQDVDFMYQYGSTMILDVWN